MEALCNVSRFDKYKPVIWLQGDKDGGEQCTPFVGDKLYLRDGITVGSVLPCKLHWVTLGL